MSNSVSHPTENHWHGPDWTLTFDGFIYHLTAPAGDRTLSPTHDSPLVVRWSWFRRFLHLGSERLVRLSGFTKSEIARLVLAVDLAEAVRWSQLISNPTKPGADLFKVSFDFEHF